jgi:glyoxylase-like metal-dependent hydrolase (beta-lactamase superfamily II)
MIKVEKFVVNPLQENSFIISDETGKCIFVDPGFYYDEEKTEVIEYVQDNNLKPVGIANTHAHFDHIMGVEFVRNEFNIPLQIHKEDAFWIDRAVDQGEMFAIDMETVAPADSYFSEGEKVRFGNSEMKIIHVPGHSPGHVVFYDAESEILVAGDVLFYGSIGRTDLPGGDYDTLITNIKNKVFELPDKTKVFCGHGPETTIGFEKQNNPFLK